jgi:hypothetical protein
LRRRYAAVHRWTGRLYLVGVSVGAFAAVYMSFHSVVGWTFGTAGIAMAAVWLATSAMGYLSNRRRQVDAHREWMVRSYVVTFAFVVFRILAISGPFKGVGTYQERMTAYLWLSWTLPLLAAEIALQWRRSFGPAAKPRSAPRYPDHALQLADDGERALQVR